MNEKCNAEECQKTAEIDLTKPVEPDLGRLAVVLTQLQTEVMNMGGQLGQLMHRVSVLDNAAHTRLTILEKKAGIVKPEAGGKIQQPPHIVKPPI